MGRSERALPPGPLHDFARDLRQLRAAKGLTYRALSRVAGYTPSALSAAASGDRLPTLDVLLAYVGACGGDTGAWQQRWHQAAGTLTPVHSGSPPSATPSLSEDGSCGADAAPAGPPPAADPASRSRHHRIRGPARRVQFGLAPLILAGAILITYAIVRSTGATQALTPALPTQPPGTGSAATPAGPVTLRSPATQPIQAVPGTAVGGTAPPAPGSPPAAAIDMNGDGVPEPIRRYGNLTLTTGATVDLDSLSTGWGYAAAAAGNPQDLEFTQQDRTLTGIDQADLAVLPAGYDGTRRACGQLQAYGSELTAPAIRDGASFCVITDQHRYALLRITRTRDDLTGQPARITLYIIVWQPQDAG